MKKAIIALIIVASFSCNTDEKMNDMTTCSNSLAAFMKLDFKDWRPLSQNCTTAMADSVFDFRPGAGALILLGTNEEKCNVRFRSGGISEQGEPLFALFYNERAIRKIQAVFMGNYPSLSQFIEEIGAPEKKLPLMRPGEVGPIAEAEWVYCDKGIALFLNEEKDRVTGISLFLPVSSEEYLKKIYMAKPVELRPLTYK
jgi:hypothetical protein